MNRAEANDEFYLVAHSTYPFDLGFLGDGLKGQILEIGADGMSGQFKPNFGNFTTFDRSVNISGTTISNNTGGSKSFSEDRVAVHAILFPQPFGLQAEWNWGKSATLHTGKQLLERTSLYGGYVQAMYKIDDFYGAWIPYARWQYYRGNLKANANSPRMAVDEIELGLEWQIMKPLELVIAYSHMRRSNMNNSAFGEAEGDLFRSQLQWNYY